MIKTTTMISLFLLMTACTDGSLFSSDPGVDAGSAGNSGGGATAGGEGGGVSTLGGHSAAAGHSGGASGKGGASVGAGGHGGLSGHTGTAGAAGMVGDGGSAGATAAAGASGSSAGAGASSSAGAGGATAGASGSSGSSGSVNVGGSAGSTGGNSSTGGAAGDPAGSGGTDSEAGAAGAGGSTVPCGPGFVCDEDTALSTGTGLRWRRRTETQSLWLDAMKHCPMTYGFSWRVPTEDELLLLVDYDNAQPPLIDQVTFENALAEAYWSSDQAQGYASIVYFTDGDKMAVSIQNATPFLCVTGP